MNTCDTLIQQRYEIGAQIESELYTLEEPSLLPFLRERDALREYVNITIATLAESLATREPETFGRHLGWMRTVLSGRGVSPAGARQIGDTFNSVLLRALPEECLDDLEPALQAGTVSFGALQHESPSYLSEEEPHYDLAKRYLDALLAAHGDEARRVILEGEGATLSMREIYLHILEPVQYEIGRMWELGRVGVADEHYASGVTQLIMAQLYARHVPLHAKEKVLVAVATDDQHELGIRMVSDFFELEGWTSVFLGGRTPVTEAARAVEKYEADLLAISATVATSTLRIRDLLGLVRTSSRPQVPVMVGGYAFRRAQGLWKELGVDGFATNAQEGLELGLRLVRKQGNGKR